MLAFEELVVVTFGGQAQSEEELVKRALWSGDAELVSK